MDKNFLDTYADYLISSFSYTTATGLSILSGGEISHDKVTRFLNSEDFRSKDLWRYIKKRVSEIARPDGVLIIDDTIEEKPSTDENEIVCWHYDHVEGRSVKGINIISALYYSSGVRVPVAFDLVRKTKTVVDATTGKTKRISEKTKNEQFYELLKHCSNNHIPYQYVLSDVWYACSANMTKIKTVLHKDFIMPMKGNRLVALSEQDKKNGRYVRVEDLKVKTDTVQKIYVEGLPFPVLLTKQIFKNENGKQGVLYLTSSDLTLTSEEMLTIYQKRWKVEEYHKSLKQHVSLAKSPTKVTRSQSNHIFAAIYGYCRLEFMSILAKIKPTTFKAKLYWEALRAAREELESLKVTYCMKF